MSYKIMNALIPPPELDLAQRAIEFKTEDTVDPQLAFEWVRRRDPGSFGIFLRSLAAYTGRVLKEYTPPVPFDQEPPDAYAKRAEIALIQWEGQVLSFMLDNSLVYPAYWGANILDQGLTLLGMGVADVEAVEKDPETMTEQELLEQEHVMAPVLKMHFEQAGLKDRLTDDHFSRLMSTLLYVRPQLLRVKPQKEVDEVLLKYLVDDKRGLTISAAIRTSIDAVNVVRAKERGVIPRQVAEVLAEELVDKRTRSPNAMKQKLTDMGYEHRALLPMPEDVEAGKFTLPDGRIVYVVTATDRNAERYLDAMFDRDPFFFRADFREAYEWFRQLGSTDPGNHRQE